MDDDQRRAEFNRRWRVTLQAEKKQALNRAAAYCMALDAVEARCSPERWSKCEALARLIIDVARRP